MPDEKIVQLIQKNQYEKEQELFKEILFTIDGFKGQISLVSVLGILDLAKDELKIQAKKD